MNNLKKLALFAVTISLFNTAYAGNIATTTQQGGVDNTIAITQTGDLNDAIVYLDGNTNTSDTTQLGNNNTSNITSTGDLNISSTYQYMDGNEATTIQSGNRNEAVHSQGSYDEEYDYSRTFSDTSTITQTGNDNYAEITQEQWSNVYGGIGGNLASIAQTGDRNVAFNFQDYSGGTNTIIQTGNDNYADTNTSGFVSATTTQLGNDNYGRISLSNHYDLTNSKLSIASISQVGDGNNADIRDGNYSVLGKVSNNTTIVQEGLGGLAGELNIAKITIIGSDSISSISQYGNANETYITDRTNQFTSKTNTVYQEGDGNYAYKYTNGNGDGDSFEVTQVGNNNTANAGYNGTSDGNFISVTQTGNNHTANMTQTGAGHSITIIQN